MEFPVTLKPKITWQEKTYSKDSDGRFCIIYFKSTVGESITPISQDSFNKLKETAADRLILPDDEQKLLHISNSIPIELDLSQHGYHRRCYQLFTRLPKPSKRKLSSSIAVVDNELPSTSKRIRRSVVASTSVLFPANQCLFCNKNTIKVRVKHLLVTCSTETAEASIEQAALEKGDEEILQKCETRISGPERQVIIIAVAESILEAAPGTQAMRILKVHNRMQHILKHFSSFVVTNRNTYWSKVKL